MRKFILLFFHVSMWNSTIFSLFHISLYMHWSFDHIMPHTLSYSVFHSYSDFFVNKRVSEFILIFVLYSLLLCSRWMRRRKIQWIYWIKHFVRRERKTWLFTLFCRSQRIFVEKKMKKKISLKVEERRRDFCLNLLRIQQEKLWLNLKLKLGITKLGVMLKKVEDNINL